MSKRLGYYAPYPIRCQAVVTLKDKSTVDCGRRGILQTAAHGRLCLQHARILAPDDARSFDVYRTADNEEKTLMRSGVLADTIVGRRRPKRK
jgi:hypothetical protein